jgi:hypothetical protein
MNVKERLSQRKHPRALIELDHLTLQLNFRKRTGGNDCRLS